MGRGLQENDLGGLIAPVGNGAGRFEARRLVRRGRFAPRKKRYHTFMFLDISVIMKELVNENVACGRETGQHGKEKERCQENLAEPEGRELTAFYLQSICI